MPFPWEEKILIRQELWQAYYPNHSVRVHRTVHFSGVSSSLKDYHAPFWTLLSLCNAQTENKRKAVVENEIQVVYKADLLDSLFSDGRTVYKGLLYCLFSSLGRVLPWNWCTVGSQAVPSLTPLFFFSQKRHQMPALLCDSQVKLQIQSHPSSTSFSPTAEGKYRPSRMI